MSTTVDIGPARKRTANIVRSEVVRERIEDYLMRSGGRISETRYRQLREDFLRTALRVAERDGLRLWRGPDKHAVRHSAYRSLLVLFGEVENITPGKNGSGAKKRSGVNVGWVLDVWEHALNVLNRETPLETQERRAAELERGLGGAEDFEEPGDGVRVFSIGSDAPKTAPLSVRMIEAYLERDDETIMRLAVELESLELAA